VSLSCRKICLLLLFLFLIAVLSFFMGLNYGGSGDDKIEIAVLIVTDKMER